MLLACAVVAVCAASNAVVSAVAPPPLPPKVHYVLENAESYFQEHIKIHKRKYDVVEYIKRFEIFKKSLMVINALNSKYPETVFGLTRFADLTTEEKNSCHRPVRGNSTRTRITENKDKMFNGTGTDAPDHFDWRSRGVVTPVKNQGSCGSCYVFGAIGNIEGQYAMKHNQCISLSEQQCMDCLPDTNCSGGLEIEVMQKLAKKGVGCMKTEDYPYVGKDGRECTEKADKVIAKVTGSEILDIQDEETLKQKLYEIGPIANGIDSKDMLFYRGGILQPESCTAKLEDDNHSVLLVGYGEGNIEGQYALKHNQCISLSEQQCLDCLPLITCAGGFGIEVLRRLTEKGVGCMKTEDYPYVAEDKRECTEKADKVVANVTDSERIDVSSDEEILKQKLADIGPLAAGLDSSGLNYYKGGILQPSHCNWGVNHEVLLVGYGEEKGVKYWIIKNSWGASFGEAGYLRLLRGVNACDIATMPPAHAHIA